MIALDPGASVWDEYWICWKVLLSSHILENEDFSNLSCPIPNKKWYILLKNALDLNLSIIMCTKVASAKKASKIYNCSMTFPDLCLFSLFPTLTNVSFAVSTTVTSTCSYIEFTAPSGIIPKKICKQPSTRTVSIGFPGREVFSGAMMWTDYSSSEDVNRCRPPKRYETEFKAITPRVGTANHVLPQSIQWTGFIVRIVQAKLRNWHSTAFEPPQDNHTGSAGDLGTVKRPRVRVLDPMGWLATQRTTRRLRRDALRNGRDSAACCTQHISNAMIVHRRMLQIHLARVCLSKSLAELSTMLFNAASIVGVTQMNSKTWQPGKECYVSKLSGSLQTKRHTVSSMRAVEFWDEWKTHSNQIVSNMWPKKSDQEHVLQKHVLFGIVFF